MRALSTNHAGELQPRYRPKLEFFFPGDSTLLSIGQSNTPPPPHAAAGGKRTPIRLCSEVAAYLTTVLTAPRRRKKWFPMGWKAPRRSSIYGSSIYECAAR